MPPSINRLDAGLKLGYLPPLAEVLPIEKLLQQVTETWWACPTSRPELGGRYLKSRQRQNQARVKKYLRLVEAAFKSQPWQAGQRREIQARLRQATLSVASEILDLEAQDLEAIEAYGFIEAAADFARRARAFDPLLRETEIFQASRNVWSMNFMQGILGLPVEGTPAVFAYSLLYPYTDNFLDDLAVQPFAKARFSQRFARRLAGEPLPPESRTEAQICRLLEMIEAQFERLRYPQVYASLQAIHVAQTRSLALLDKSLSPNEGDRLGICFEKSGTSVLAGCVLVAGGRSGGQAGFFFYCGWLF